MAGTASQPVCLDLEMTVCLENGAVGLEAKGFRMRNQFGLSSRTNDAQLVRFTSFIILKISMNLSQHYRAEKG